MKTIILLLLIALCGCDENINPNGRQITSKAYLLEPNKKLLPCICMYEYWIYGNRFMFEDSCNKYNIGDTIK